MPGFPDHPKSFREALPYTHGAIPFGLAGASDMSQKDAPRPLSYFEITRSSSKLLQAKKDGRKLATQRPGKLTLQQSECGESGRGT